MHKKRAQKNAIKHLKPKTPRQATARPSPIRVSSSTYITSVSDGCPPPHPPTLPTKSAPHIVKAGPRSNRRMIGTPPPSAPHPRARPCPPRACRRPQGRPPPRPRSAPASHRLGRGGRAAPWPPRAVRHGSRCHWVTYTRGSGDPTLGHIHT